MWILSSNQDAPCVRPLKPATKADDGAYNPSIWIRPGKEYTAGRSEAFDLCITHQKLSRKKLGFILKASAIDPGSTLLQEERDVHTPAYSLTIEAGEQGLLATDESGAEAEIKHGCQFAIQDGMQINAFAEKKRECIMRFRWRPVHIYNRVAKKKELPALQQVLATLGITFTIQSGGIHPNATHTHAIFPKFSLEPSAIQLVAANCQLLMVEPSWLDALVKAAEPVQISTGGDEPRQIVKSQLELDFERNWPSEPRYFPSVDGREATTAEKKVWLPNPHRRTLFQGMTFVDCSLDPNIAVLTATAGGKVYAPDFSNVRDFGPTVSRFLADAALSTRGSKKYLILPHFGTLLQPEQYIALTDAKESFDLDGYVHAAAIFASIKDVLPLHDIVTEYVDAARGAPLGDSVQASSSIMPGATADISYPSTHPDDLPASVPKQILDLKRPQPPTLPINNRPNKKPRKLADRGIADPLANLFLSSTERAAATTVAAESEVDSQVKTQLGATSTTRPAEADSQDLQSQSKYLRPDSKYSKLKRRVGVGQGSQSQLVARSLLDQTDESDQLPTKAFRSFDPSIESVTSQAAARIREKEKKENLAGLLADDGDLQKSSTSKRKAVESPPGSDAELSSEAAQSKPRKKATLAKNETRPDKKQAQDDERPPARESVYLQVKTSRRNIGKADADINEDFNNLRIRKTQAPESHKMGWHERDVFQEEMAEDAAWEAEDKSTFFQVRFVPMARPKNAATPDDGVIDPRWIGKPNFKAFKPKTTAVSTSAMAGQGKKRAEIALVAYEAPTYGLQERYEERGRRDKGGQDSDTSIEMPMADLDSTRKGKRRSRATATTRSTKTRKGKKPAVSDTSEEDELKAEDSSTAREESAPMTRNTRPKESITIDSSSDEEDGRVFRGFGASSRISAGRR